VGSNWPNNEDNYNRDAGFEPRILPLRWHLRNTSFKFCVKLHVRRGLQALRLGIAWMTETQVSSSASWPLHWSRDAIFDSRVLILQWCWDAAFMLCVLIIAVILRRGFQPSRLGAALVAMSSLASWVCFLMTCPQWFLDSLQYGKTKLLKSSKRKITHTQLGDFP